MAIDFNNTQTIYMQIVDWVFDQVLTGAWKPGDKAKSVRELAVMFEVNPNTVMRPYDYLQNNGIFLNKRGIGFFVAGDALDVIRDTERRKFIDEELPLFRSRASLLGIDLKDFIN